MDKSFRRPPSGWNSVDTQKRIDWVKKYKNIDYSNVLFEAPENLSGIIEQQVGFNTIPMAVASPLCLHGDYAQGNFIVPVCTVEGSLVYSLTRGMMATAENGGILVHHLGQRVNRSPVFLLKSIKEIAKFIAFAKEHHEEIKNIAESTTRYGKLVEVNPIVIHRSVVLDMIFETGNAAGQNMVTIAAKYACEYIRKNFPIEQYFLESGFNCDKKASRLTMTSGRGHSVVAEAYISEKTLRRLLGVTSKDVLTFLRAGESTTHFTGVIGAHLHISNALTAVYMATGQDVACVAENALGNLDCVGEEGGGITLHVRLPSLTIGTVGGGTRLPSQKRNLELIGCAEGEHSAKKLAEIIVGVSMCLEVSLLAVIVSNTFAEAHKKFGRNDKNEK